MYLCIRLAVKPVAILIKEKKIIILKSEILTKEHMAFHSR